MGKIHDLYKLYKSSNKTNSEFIEFITNPANINCINEIGENSRTVLFAAAYDDDEEIVKLLLQRKADVHVKDRFNNTPLLHIMTGPPDINMPIVRLLIAAGADINEKDGLSWTMLHYTVGNSLIKSLHLIALGADINITNSKNETPITIAFTRDIENKSQMLLLLFKKEWVISQDLTGIDFTGPDVPSGLTDGVIMIGSTIKLGDPPQPVPVTRQMEGLENAITTPEEFAQAAENHQYNFAALELAIKDKTTPVMLAFKQKIQEVKAKQKSNVPTLKRSIAHSMANLSLFPTSKSEALNIEDKIKGLPIELRELIEEEKNHIAIERAKSQLK